jgi:hypothetical protein
VLELLDWDLSAITPYCVLDQLIRRLLQPLNQRLFDLKLVRSHAETFVALTVSEATFLTTSPPLLAVASLVAALSGLRRSNEQNELLSSLLHHLLDITGLSIDEVSEVMVRIEDTVRLRLTSEITSKTASIPASIQHQQVASATKSSYCSNNNNSRNQQNSSLTPTEMVEISAVC